MKTSRTASLQSTFSAKIVKIDNNMNIETEFAELEIASMFECVIDHECDYKIYAMDSRGHWEEVGFYNSCTDEYHKMIENVFDIITDDSN